MKLFAIILLLFLVISPSMAQKQPDPSVQIEEMKKLSFMNGTWAGTGWAQGQDGQTHQFNQAEVIQTKLAGTALLIEGTGKDPESGEITFNAMAIISFDTSTGKYSFRSYLSTGQATDAEGYFEEDNFIWSFDTPGGTVRYTMTFSDDHNKWNEIGEFSRDGSQWYKFIEMNLKKSS